MKVINYSLIFVLVVSSVRFCDALFFGQSDVLDILDRAPISDGMDKINMIYYERSSENVVPYNYSLDQSKELMKYIDTKKPFVLYIFGYQEHPSNESCQTIVSAYTERGTDNIIILDWSAFAFGNYVTVALRAKDIAKYTAKAIQNLVTAGLDVDNLHVVGHSLGAQVAGFIGRYIDFKIPRVTGLDPANPLFYQFGADHINENSGIWVDVIHTDGGFYGAYSNTGSVDFYANGGVRPQPGCPLFGVPLSQQSFCHHVKSWRYWSESVINDKAFPALKCDLYSSYLLGRCKGNEVVYFGYSAPKNITGSYFFDTNAEYPFGKGLEGIRN